jgi:hypothetical protein
MRRISKRYSQCFRRLRVKKDCRTERIQYRDLDLREE